jgi:hypothetical protein
MAKAIRNFEPIDVLDVAVRKYEEKKMLFSGVIPGNTLTRWLSGRHFDQWMSVLVVVLMNEFGGGVDV